MSADAREALAAAASTVAGVTGLAYPPPVPGVGDAWPQITQVDTLNLPSVQWSVVLVLPPDIGDASRMLDEKLSEMVAALDREMAMMSVRPGSMTVGGAQLLVAEFRGRREL